MENVAHSLVGFLGARAGLGRLTPGATAACIIAANIPDTDIAAGLGGRWFLLQNHRGITHSILGVAVLPFLLTVGFCVCDLILARLRGSPRQVRFWPLLLASFLMCATHPILDWTNNYGIRPFLPWSGRWIYGDLVSIVDPWIWLMAGGTLFLATSNTRFRIYIWIAVGIIFTGAFWLLLGRTRLSTAWAFSLIWFSGLALYGLLRWYFPFENLRRRTAVIGLLLIVSYWCGLAVVHATILYRAAGEISRFAAERGESVVKVAALPTFVDPRNWIIVAETSGATYRYPVTLGGVTPLRAEQIVRFQRLTGKDAEALCAASLDPRAKVFLGFARFPVEAVGGDCLSGLLVEFADLRYTQPEASQKGAFGLDIPVSCDRLK